MDKTAVVILNYNGVQHLERFLPSVTKHSGDCQIVIIDNHSSDRSIDFIEHNYPEIRVIKLAQNYGYSGGYNRGLKEISAENYILLNSDVEVTAGWVGHLMQHMQDHPEVAICQPKILSLQYPNHFDYAGAAGGFVDMMGYPFCRGRIFNNLEEDRGQYDTNLPIFWASGACFVIRSQVFHELGGFDEDFFAHMEEIDLCWRSHRAGYKASCVSSSMVLHLGGGTLKDTNPLKTYLNFRNGLQLLIKNCSVLQLLWKIPVRILLDLLASLTFLLQGSFGHALAVLKAEIFFLMKLHHTWSKRKRWNHYNGGLYPKLIVWEYFIRGRKTFEDMA